MPRITFLRDCEKLSCAHSRGSPASAMAFRLKLSKNAPRLSRKTFAVSSSTPGRPVSVIFMIRPLGFRAPAAEIRLAQQRQQILAVTALRDGMGQSLELRRVD